MVISASTDGRSTVSRIHPRWKAFGLSSCVEWLVEPSVVAVKGLLPFDPFVDHHQLFVEPGDAFAGFGGDLLGIRHTVTWMGWRNGRARAGTSAPPSLRKRLCSSVHSSTVPHRRSAQRPLDDAATEDPSRALSLTAGVGSASMASSAHEPRWVTPRSHLRA